MDQLSRIANDMADALPRHTIRRAVALVAALALATQCAADDLTSPGSEASPAPLELRQPAWNEPQSAASQAPRRLEVPGLQQPGFLAPTNSSPGRLEPTKRDGAARRNDTRKKVEPAIAEETPGLLRPIMAALPQLTTEQFSTPPDAALMAAPHELHAPNASPASAAAKQSAGELAPSLWQQFAGTNGEPSGPPAGPSYRQANAAPPVPNAAPNHALGTVPSPAPQVGELRDRVAGLMRPLVAADHGAPHSEGPSSPSTSRQALDPILPITPGPARTASSEAEGWRASGSSASPGTRTTANHDPRRGSAPPSGMIAPPNPRAIAERAMGREGEPSPLSSLWRPLVMSQNEVYARQDASAATSTGTPAGRGAPAIENSGLEASLENSLLVRPFLMVDESRRDGRNARPSGPSNDASLAQQLRGSSLMRQLALGANDDLTRPVELLANSPLHAVEEGWDEGWVAQTPATLDPFLMALGTGTAETTSPATDAQLVAFMQEALPEPAGDNANGQSAGGAAGANNQNNSLAGAEQVGEEPEDNTLQFLRTATVLLKPGDSQCDIGFTYLFSENQFPILLANDTGAIIGVDEVDFRVRELAIPFEYRFGLLKRVQGFIGASVGWANTEVSLGSFEAFENDGGFGDVNFGLTGQLLDATANCPYVIATVQATAPTGGDPFDLAAMLAPSSPALGQGFWSVAANVLFIQPYDPVVLFYGVGMEHFFSEEYRGIEFEPGSQWNYTFGVGFAVNERVTLSTRFFGAYVEELKADGERLFNTNLEPMTMRFAATISKPCDRIVEPFVEFGITDDSVSSFFGITWTY